MEHVTERSARKQHKENPWQHQMPVTLRFFFVVPKCTAGQTFHHVLLPGALERSSEMLSPLAIGGLLAGVTGALWWTVLGYLAAHCSMRSIPGSDPDLQVNNGEPVVHATLN
jgi:hypothetical protein